MEDQQERLNYLLQLHASQSLTKADREELSALLQRVWLGSGNLSRKDHPDWEKMLTEIVSETARPPVRRIRLTHTRVLRYAAAVLLLFGSAAYFFIDRDPYETPDRKPADILRQQPDVLPGSDKAILILSSGDQVELNGVGEKTIMDGNLAINSKKGTLVYKNTAVVVKNTVRTPNGGQYKLSLPDGSLVWLNAASSITFPTAFKGKSREVSVRGEAYFEIAPNRSQPFIVDTRKEKIMVVGTQFNVNCYDDEPVGKISLLKGSISVDSHLLKPGEAYSEGKIARANLDLDLAWKNGVFRFDKTRIDVVMRQLSRWYDIKVQYPDGIPELIISGSIGMDLKLSQTITGLKALGVNAVHQDNVLIVKN